MRFLALALIACALVFTPGCATTSTPPTVEAIKFNSLKSTWVSALSAHDFYSELVLMRKVSTRDQADIDRAWDDFRAAFKVAVLLSENDLSAQTPDSLYELKEDVITLIRSL